CNGRAAIAVDERAAFDDQRGGLLSLRGRRDAIEAEQQDSNQNCCGKDAAKSGHSSPPGGTGRDDGDSMGESYNTNGRRPHAGIRKITYQAETRLATARILPDSRRWSWPAP